MAAAKPHEQSPRDDEEADLDSEITARMAAKARHRSPNYPFIDLEKAIERARQIYDLDRRHEVPVTVAAKDRWKYKPGGSQSDQTIAALKAYGLVEVSGVGDSRMIRISDRAYRILASAPDAPARVRDAALSPSIHGELWQKYSTGGFPGDEVIRSYLLFDRPNGHFNEDVVGGVIDRFKSTISYAKLVADDKIPEVIEAEIIDAGDWIQWESQGIMRGPKKVQRVTDDGDWVFVDSEPDGIPAHHVELVDPPIQNTKDIPTSDRAVPPPNPSFQPLPNLETRRYVYTVDTGDAIIQWPAILSEEDCKGIENWLEGLKTKIKRSVKVESPESPTERPKPRFDGQG